jgi:hypothetical protein
MAARRSIGITVLSIATIVHPSWTLAQPDLPLTGKWLGKVKFPATGERANGDVVFESPNGQCMFLKQPLIDIKLRDQKLTFTWGEGEGAVRCTLPWDKEKATFLGACVGAKGHAAAELEFTPPAEDPVEAPQEAEAAAL